LYWLTGPVKPQIHPEHLCQAESWATGHWYIDSDFCQATIGEKIEWPSHSNHWYSIHPPLAAVVMFVARPLLGVRAVSCLIGALATVLCFRLTSMWWVTVLFAAGTNFWYEISIAKPWGMTSCLGCLMLFALMLSKNSTLKGFFGGLACLARYDLLGAVMVFTLTNKRRAWMALALIPAILFYWLNAYEKFGTWWDIGITTWYKHDGHVVDNFGPFSLRYLPWNIYTNIYLPPSFNPSWPWFRPQTTGQSLLTTSPALLLALRASFTTYYWYYITIMLSMAGPLLVWSNGYVQFGCRYWIMVYPLLMWLISRTPMDQFAKILIVASVIFNAYGVWYINSGQPF